VEQGGTLAIRTRNSGGKDIGIHSRAHARSGPHSADAQGCVARRPDEAGAVCRFRSRAGAPWSKPAQ